MLANAGIRFSSDFGCWQTRASVFCLISDAGERGHPFVGLFSDAGKRGHPFFVRSLWNLVPFPECYLFIHDEINCAVNEEAQELRDVLVPPE